MLVRRRFQCDGGKSRCASASGSASSSALAALRQHPTSISHAAWYMATAVAAYLARKTEEKMLAHAAPQLPGAGLAHAVAHRC